jgi:hypothetical protein
MTGPILVRHHPRQLLARRRQLLCGRKRHGAAVPYLGLQAESSCQRRGQGKGGYYLGCQLGCVSIGAGV